MASSPEKEAHPAVRCWHDCECEGFCWHVSECTVPEHRHAHDKDGRAIQPGFPFPPAAWDAPDPDDPPSTRDQDPMWGHDVGAP